MTYKQTMTINKGLHHAALFSFSPAALIARLKNAVKLDIPVGYQDESGFHTGVKADEKEIKWPANW
jgi:hypothetical protein